MTEVKRGPGRPPKVRPEAAPVPTEQVMTAETRTVHLAPFAAALEVKPAVERMVEIEILRKYAPYGQKQEIRTTVPPGTIMKLPVVEATRALKLGIARATDDTFN